ncbi:fimbrial outer membrane usher protein [Klebsiella sp. MISC125]|uniref:fimbrial outer membrane usher protein n=1 Tax=Klebsiella sp. MISC125 TaxID=2755386 RepID=UPI003DA9E153
MLLPGSAAAEYYFDPTLLQGSGYDSALDLSRFNQSDEELPTADYVLDIWLNGQLLRGQETITFAEPPENKGRTEPCLTPVQIEISTIRVPAGSHVLPETPPACRFISALGKNIRWEVDTAALRLNISVPQAELYRDPRGYIPASEWEAGNAALFLRHNTNLYRTENTSSGYRYDYLWSNINTGLNFGLWQLRHQGNLRYSDDSISGGQYRYNSSRVWLQRPLQSINSVLTLGDATTDSSLFGSLSFNGIRLRTDPQMWPQGKRGYAPEVRGVANTTARVEVLQQGKVIYETTVSPGAFVINDLYNTTNQGDLNVRVIEADGQISTFTVPYSSVPDSVRPGNWSYGLAGGYVRHYYDQNNKFVEGILKRGVNNYLTSNSGIRIADGYQAGLLGGVIATSAGAFGLNAVYSRAQIEHGRNEQGWRLEASYGKAFSTGTNLMLAAYRYSTRGYRDLQDVLGVRQQYRDHITYHSDTLYQRNHLSATLNQSMDRWGILSLNASTADYYSDASRLTQIQLGYSNSWRNIGFNLNFARQRTVQTSRNYGSFLDTDDRSRRYTENTFSFNVSVPLNFGQNSSQLMLSANRSGTGDNVMASTSGTAGEAQAYSWSVYTGLERPDQDSNSTTFGGSLETRTSFGALRGTASRGHDYRQYGLGTSGTLLVHSGGLTVGPYTSDTFALIAAPGAKGATIRNGQGAKVDRFGYALLPSLTPYRYNTVSLETGEMNGDVELQGGSKRVVPYAGAITRVTFATLSGQAVLINTTLTNGSAPPMGAEVADSKGASLGMVGQAGQIYARLPDQSGVLYVSWGTKASQQCRVYYQLPAQRPDTGIHQLALPCKRE